MPVASNARFVPWSGPCPADLAVIGEAPGPTENKREYPFAGKSGHYLDRFLSMAGEPRNFTFVWNVCHFWPGKDKDGKQLPPDEFDIARDGESTVIMLHEVQPKIIAAVGKVAVRFLTGLPDSLEILHGKLLQPRADLGLQCGVVACYHPASGMYSPSLMEKVYWDFQQVGLAMRGRIQGWPEQTPVRVYLGRDLFKLSSSVWRPGPMGLDTEGTPENPISLQFSFHRGEGVVCETIDEISWFKAKILPLARPVVMHNAPWDLRVLEEMGVFLEPGSFVDTMMLGYHVRAEQKPKRDDQDDGDREGAAGLKDLSRRHLGRFMKSYDDTLAPTILGKFREIVAERYVEESATLEPQLTKSGKPKKKQKAVELSQIGKRLENLISVLEEREVSELRTRWVGMQRDFPDAKLPSFPTATLDEIPRGDFLSYAAADPAATVGVYPILRAEHSRKMLETTEQIDLGAVPMFARMNQIGMLFDAREAYRLAVYFKDKADAALASLQLFAGRSDFNPGSTADLRWLLYQRLGMKPPMRTPKGDPSTDEKCLAILKQRADERGLEEQIETIDSILKFREANKHLRTYVLPLMDQVRQDGSISPDIMLTNTATGRPAGLFLTFPAHTEDGKKIRSLFKARPGCEFVTIDLSQIEMRVMAHAADEENMKRAFREGVDIHVFTASEMFHVPPGEVDKVSQRTPAKMIGFGIIYLIGPPGLSKNLRLPPPQGPGLNYSVEDSEKLINRWYQVFPGVKDFQEGEKLKLRRTGEARGLFGRLRYLPTIWSPDEFERAEAERAACNHPIQDGAQCIEKMGMAQIWPRMPELRRRFGYVEPILQIHDELIFEVTEGRAAELAEVVGDELVAAGSWMDVPVEWGKAVGPDWGSLEK